MLRSTGNCGKCLLKASVEILGEVSEVLVVLVYSLDILLSKAVHNLV